MSSRAIIPTWPMRRIARRRCWRGWSPPAPACWRAGWRPASFTACSTPTTWSSRARASTTARGASCHATTRTSSPPISTSRASTASAASPRRCSGTCNSLPPASPWWASKLDCFSDPYRPALREAILDRLGLRSQGPDADVGLVNAAFRALADGGEALRWEPFFFDWFGCEASEGRALSGPRAGLYESEAFQAFRARLADYSPDPPERLAD